METIAQRTLEMYQQILQVIEDENQREELEAKAERLRLGVELFQNIFGEEPTVEEDCLVLEVPEEARSEYNPDHPKIRMKYAYSHGRKTLGVLGKCPRCEASLVMGEVCTAYDLGCILANWSVPYHDCQALITAPPRKNRLEALQEHLDFLLDQVDDGVVVSYERVKAQLAAIQAEAFLKIAEELESLNSRETLYRN